MRCPICRGKFSHDDCIKENLKDEFIDLASFFGRGWMAVNEYIDCFRSSKYGSVGEKKRLRHLQEVKALFEFCEFELNKKKYRTDKQSIYGAIRVIIDKEEFNFKNHTYLFKVLAEPFEGTPGVVKAQRVSAEGLTAREESERDTARRNPPSHKAMEDRGEKRKTFAEFKKDKDVRDLADLIMLKEII